MLDTSMVSIHSESVGLPMSFDLGKSFLLWQRQDYVRVMRGLLPLQDVVRLAYVPALPIVLRLLRRTKQSVREKLHFNDPGQDVLIF